MDIGRVGRGWGAQADIGRVGRGWGAHASWENMGMTISLGDEAAPFGDRDRVRVSVGVRASIRELGLQLGLT